MGEKTVSAVKHVVEHAKLLDERLETEIIDLKEYHVEFCDGRQTADYNEDTQKVIHAVLSADCFIIGTPIFQASLAAPLKNLFDLLPPSAFRNKVIGFVGTGGTYQHFLVIENQLKPIAGYFRAYTAPDYVYVNRDHFDANNRIADSAVVERVEALAAQVLHMSKSLIS